jgi:rhodanese-related sulfurtransferase
METHMKYDFEQAREHFAARNAFTTGPHEVAGFIDAKQDIIIVDVRFPADYKKGHIPGAVSLPKGKWHDASALSKDKLNVLYCYNPTCHLAAEAAAQLVAAGYPVVEMEGGFSTWEANGASVEVAQAVAA